MKKFPMSLTKGAALRATLVVFFSLFTLHSSLFSAFKETGFGARPAGMGGAFAGLADDANAPLFNPAGLGLLKGSQATFMLHKPFVGFGGVSIHQGYASFVHNAPNIGSLGVNFTNLTVSDLTRETSVSLSYARSITQNVKNPFALAGVNIKYLYHTVKLDARTQSLNDPVFSGGTSRGALTADLGFLVRPGAFGFGVSAKNLTTPDVSFSGNGSDPVPVELRLGGSYRHPRKLGPIENGTLVMDVSVRAPRDAASDINVLGGAEGWFMNRALGLRLGASSREAAMGVSFQKNLTPGLSLSIDYAFTFPLQLRDTSGSHRLSLSMRFPPGGKKSQERHIPHRKSLAPYSGLTPQEKKVRMERHYTVGYKAYRQGDYEAAIEEWEEVLRLDPEHTLSKRNIQKAKGRLLNLTTPALEPSE